MMIVLLTAQPRSFKNIPLNFKYILMGAEFFRPPSQKGVHHVYWHQN